MVKSDIIERLANANGYSRAENLALVDAILAIIKETLADGEAVKISRFGSFTIRDRTTRRGRNPHTGEEIAINARRILMFKPSPILENMINKFPELGHPGNDERLHP